MESDLAGRFRISGLTGGSRCVRVEHPRVATTVLTLDRILPNEQRQLGFLTLGPGVAVAGAEERARLELPHEVAPTLLLAEELSGRQVRLLTSVQPLLALGGVVLRADASGQLQLPRLAEGVWLVDAGDGGAPRRLTLRRGDEEIDWSRR